VLAQVSVYRARCRLPYGPCHCHPLSLASVKSRSVLPFWYRLTRVVPDKGPLNGSLRPCLQIHRHWLPVSYRIMFVLCCLIHMQYITVATVAARRRPTWRKPDVDLGILKTKFHYASWFGAGSKLVRIRQRNGIWLRTSFEQAPNQLV